MFVSINCILWRQYVTSVARIIRQWVEQSKHWPIMIQHSHHIWSQWQCQSEDCSYAQSGSRLVWFRFWVHFKFSANEEKSKYKVKSPSKPLFVLISDSRDEVFCPSLGPSLGRPISALSHHSLPDSVHLILIDPEWRNNFITSIHFLSIVL